MNLSSRYLEGIEKKRNTMRSAAFLGPREAFFVVCVRLYEHLGFRISLKDGQLRFFSNYEMS